VSPPAADLTAVFERQLAAHRRLFAELDGLADSIAAAAERMAQALAGGGRLFFFGNGGSACDSMHIAAELTGRLKTDRQPLAAMALNADVAALTAVANDYGFEAVFARQLQALARPGDCAIALSTSGNSPNVLQALHAARAAGVATIALLGRGGGAARQLADLALVAPHTDSARIQEAHIFIGHTWCAQIESRLGLASH
jgi:D-sedoheptulose 7-phosphate isomerase